MSLHGELLDTARYLLRRNQNRPSQADLRRGVSTAYYALFHLLIREATEALVDEPGLRGLVPRAFNHGEMKEVCQWFTKAPLPKPLAAVTAGPVPGDLKAVAKAFLELQDARHAADYDIVATSTRTDAYALVQQAERAFAAWERVRGEPVANVFLASLRLGKRWSR